MQKMNLIVSARISNSCFFVPVIRKDSGIWPLNDRLEMIVERIRRRAIARDSIVGFDSAGSIFFLLV